MTWTPPPPPPPPAPRPAPGRRERKKAATRKAISDAAMALFLERGFDAVSTKEVAEAADVSPTTLFAHFPQKEALVFDEDEEQRQLLVDAVRDRPAGVSAIGALHAHLRALLVDDPHSEGARRFQSLVASAPSLGEYASRMWLRYGEDLADELADEAGLEGPTPEISAFARFVMQIYILAAESPDPAATLEAGFRVLDGGWARYARTVGLGG